MTIPEIDKKIKTVEYYLKGTDKLTQFWEVCIIARDSLEILKYKIEKVFSY